MTLLLWICSLLGVIGFFQSRSLGKRLDKLEKRISEQTTLLHILQGKKPKEITETSSLSVTDPTTIENGAQPSAALSSSELHTSGDYEGLDSVSQIRSRTNIGWSALYDTHPIPEWANQAFNWLKENWAGFIGVSILVLGIIFGAFYLGFFATPLVRFFMVLSIGLLLAVASFILKNKTIWQDLSGWLLAGSGAIILFSVIASSLFPALKFYHDPIIGLYLLVAALIINIVFAYLCAKQTLATFHVLINLLALTFIPKVAIVIVAGTIVSLAGIALSYKKAWNINLLAIMLGFTLFHYLWFIAQVTSQPIALLGIGCTIAIGLSALLVHYQKIYIEIDEKINNFIHISIWLLFGIQLFWYNLGFKYVVVPLGLAASITFALSLYAKRKNIQWLYLTDAIIGQMLSLLTIISLSRVEIGYDVVAWLAMIESLCFTSICYFSRQKILSDVGIGLTSLSFIVFSLMLFANYQDYQKVLMMSIATFIPIYGTRWFIAIKDNIQSHEKNEIPFALMLDILWTIIGSILLWDLLHGYHFGYPAFITAMLLLAFNKAIIKEKIHQLCYLLLLGQTLAFSWFKLNSEGNQLITIALYAFPSLLLMLATLKAKIFQFNDQQLNREDLWVYSLALHLFIMNWILFVPISLFIPGIGALILGVLFFETSQFLCKKSSNSRNYLIAIASLNMAVFYLLIFVGLYSLVYLQSEASLFANFSIREILTIIAMLLSFYWYFSKSFDNNPFVQYRDYHSIRLLYFSQAITFDIGLFFVIAYIVVEYSAPIHPIGYGLTALILSTIRLRMWLPVRSLVYAIGLLYALCIQVAIVSSTWASPLSDWYQTTHITGPISIVIALMVASLLLKQTQYHNDNKIIAFYSINPILFGFLPIFIALALFLLWRFDKAYLTMLWVTEIFFIVIFSFLLKHKSLIRLAFAFLAFCVLRLIFYDLAQTDLLIRALVFVAIGLLMIFIHMIYKKYAGRLT
ncbi:MAG: hypothetical protein BGO43_04025 [Gammaproteobacteria bacterium 39-13]|nr:hypothetical protein [Gammaproteobacteria bacterium]OJV94859.1 MAG: hypothetical protein BGO43_04025 [Gammaproteobacteria bacterium 39-13]